MSTLEEIYNQGRELYGSSPSEFTDKGTWHSYIGVYQELFNQYPGVVKMLDIGVHAGGSLWLWSNYLPTYEVWGMDISPNFIPERPFQVDLINDPDVHTLWNRDSTLAESYNDVPNEFDIIIDDGDHHEDAQIKTFFAAWPKLSENGTYIIEDVPDRGKVEYIISKIQEFYTDLKFDIWYGPKTTDDIIIKISRVTSVVRPLGS